MRNRIPIIPNNNQKNLCEFGEVVQKDMFSSWISFLVNLAPGKSNNEVPVKINGMGPNINNLIVVSSNSIRSTLNVKRSSPSPIQTIPLIGP